MTTSQESLASRSNESLIADLAIHDGLRRQEAREELVRRRHSAVNDLIEALRSPIEQARWEAAKALSTIADPVATEALADALLDPNADIRWIAAEGLIAIDEPAVWAVLKRLTRHADSVAFREAAHHVLHAHCDDELREVLAPVLVALDGSSPESAAPVAAYRVLHESGRHDEADGPG